MTHNEAWQFAKLGWAIERADKTSRILDVKYFMLLPRVDYVGSPYDNLQWAGLLRCLSALEMFRKVYRQLTPRLVAEFLILNEDFPRSIRFSLAHAELALHTITGTRGRSFANIAEQHMGRLRSDLDYAAIDEILNSGLHEYLDFFQSRLNTIGGAIHETFFAARRPAETASAADFNA